MPQTTVELVDNTRILSRLAVYLETTNPHFTAIELVLNVDTVCMVDPLEGGDGLPLVLAIAQK